jgi:hypothetical protein
MSGSRTSKRAPAGKAKTVDRWSAEVTRHSNALDLEPAVFNNENGVSP